MTKRTLLAPIMGLALLALAVPAHAQSNRAALTLLGGGSVHGDLTPGYTEETRFEPGWVVGLQGEGWLWDGRFGLRVNTAFTQRTVDGQSGDYNLYSGDLGVLFRPLPVRPGRVLAPYLTLGGGLTRYASVGGSPPFADGIYGGDPVTRLHSIIGAGVDVLASPRFGLRFEAADRIVYPSIGESPESTGLPTVHNGVFTAGVQLRLGRLPAARVVASRVPRRRTEPAVERPAPEPEPVVEPEPEPVVEPQPEPEPEPQPEPEPEPEPEPQPEPVVEPRPEPAPAEAPSAAEQGLYTVQVGSYVEPATAARWAGRLRERGIPVWLLGMDIQGQRVHRVRVGAGSEAEAQRLARYLDQEYGWPVAVEAIEPGEPFPHNAVSQTREFLGQ